MEFLNRIRNNGILKQNTELVTIIRNSWTESGIRQQSSRKQELGIRKQNTEFVKFTYILYDVRG